MDDDDDDVVVVQWISFGLRITRLAGFNGQILGPSFNGKTFISEVVVPSLRGVQ